MRVVSLLCTVLLAAPAINAQDTTKIRANAAPQWGDQVRLLSQFSIGKVSGPPEFAFGAIEYVASASNGTFFVFDRQFDQVRRYDATGKFTGNVGRSGQGPGEYSQPTGMEMIGDSLLAVWDARGGRVVLFSAAGTYKSSFDVSRSGFFSQHDFSIDGAGIISIRLGTGRHEEPISQWVRFRANGSVVDSTFVPAPPPNAPRSFLLITQDGGRWSFPATPFLTPYRGGGFITGFPANNSFTIARGRERPINVERSWRPIAVATAEREEWIAFGDHLVSRGRGALPPGASGAIVRPGGEGPGVSTPYEIPRGKPAFRGILSDTFGRVWVEMYTTAEKRTLPPRPVGVTGPRLTWRERNVYDVFAPAGNYLGRVELPANTSIVSFQRDRVWLLSKGPDDEDILTVSRIDTPALK